MAEKEITKIGIETGQPFVGLTEGLSALIQAEIPAEEALIRLRAAAKFTAIVGAEATDSVAAIVKIMRTFGMSTEETNEFFNKLLEAIRIAPVPAKEFLDALGLKLSGLDRMIQKCYQLLDLVTFMTVGPKECRAWTVKKGTKAPQAAGVIHTDFEKAFIRAEIIPWQDFVDLGESGARDKGKLRVEGKDYVIQDGDTCHFRVGV